MKIHLLLASQSPRRRQLMALAGYPFSAISANVDESQITDPDPAVNVVKTAVLKAQAIATQIKSGAHSTIIVAADTTVALDEQMLGKPRDASQARHMLLCLRDRTHEVYTGMVLRDVSSGQMVEAVHTAVVTMRPFTDQEITDYIATGDPFDKAGAYAIQHPQFRPVANLAGCYLGVMGLSICQLCEMLAHLNVTGRPDRTTLLKAHHGYDCSISGNF